MDGTKRRVVVADPIDVKSLEPLRGDLCELVDATAGEAALSAQLPEAWAIIVRSRTKITKSVLERAPKLSLLARAGVGVDNIDVPAASARGIRVVNAPSAATASVAELSIGLYIMLARDLYARIAKTKSGDWVRSGNGSELSGKTVGFIGYGRIAREIARRLVPFGARAIAYDPYVKSSADATEMVGLDALLSTSDYVSVHAAATEESRHLLNAERLARMKKGAFLVNVARGPLVDEASLIRALDSGALAGAALDVFEVEPPTRTELLAHPKVICTPHLGASTHEAQARAGKDTIDEVLRALRGEPLRSLVNPSVAGKGP